MPSPNNLVVYKSHLTTEQIEFKKLSCGSKHSILLSVDNYAYSFGWNKYEQLFQEIYSDEADDEKLIDFEEPSLIFEMTETFLDIKCGVWFTLIAFK